MNASYLTLQLERGAGEGFPKVCERGLKENEKEKEGEKKKKECSFCSFFNCSLLLPKLNRSFLL